MVLLDLHASRVIPGEHLQRPEAKQPARSQKQAPGRAPSGRHPPSAAWDKEQGDGNHVEQNDPDMAVCRGHKAAGRDASHRSRPLTRVRSRKSVLKKPRSD